MLTELEKHGISELLERMSSGDLTSLAQTVTSRRPPETDSKAISAIILHTDRPADLLRRRKVKKEYLFKYLNAKRVPVEATADKTIVMAAVLQLWGSSATTRNVAGMPVAAPTQQPTTEAPLTLSQLLVDQTAQLQKIMSNIENRLGERISILGERITNLEKKTNNELGVLQKQRDEDKAEMKEE